MVEPADGVSFKRDASISWFMGRGRGNERENTWSNDRAIRRQHQRGPKTRREMLHHRQGSYSSRGGGGSGRFQPESPQRRFFSFFSFNRRGGGGGCCCCATVWRPTNAGAPKTTRDRSCADQLSCVRFFYSLHGETIECRNRKRERGAVVVVVRAEDARRQSVVVFLKALHCALPPSKLEHLFV